MKLRITDSEELKKILEYFHYDLLVPIFGTPGRQLIAYAKRHGNWGFVGSDIWLGNAQYNFLAEFMNHVDQKLRSNGYATEDGMPGLIDHDEM